jgi:DNA-binding Lrp family transcriptional regulator
VSFVSNTEFVKVWANSTSSRDVAQKLGITRDWVRKRAKRLRKAGVALPHFIRRNPYFVDFQKLNALYRAEKERAKIGGAALGVASGKSSEAED